MAATTPNLEQVLPAFARQLPTQLVPAGPQFVEDQLLVGLEPDAQGRGRRLELAFLPRDQDDFHYLQYFVQLPFEAAQSQAADLARLVTALNVKLPLGHFGYDEPNGWVYYRHVAPCPSAPLDPDLVVNTAAAVFYLVDQLGSVLEPVATGSGSLEDAMREVEGATTPPPVQANEATKKAAAPTSRRRRSR